MSADESEPLEPLTAMLEALLAQQLEGFESVEISATLSAGATRQTHEIAIDTGQRARQEAGRLRAVAQLRITESSSETLPVEAEYELLRAAQRAGAPVAAPLACGTLPNTRESGGESSGEGTGDAAGTEALISEFCVGETIPRRVLRHLEALGPTAGDALAAQVAVAAAGLHSTTAPDLPDALLDALPTFSPAPYLDHLTELLDQLPTSHPALRFGVEFLRGTDQVRSSPATPSLVHGDFRLGNLAVADGELRAVLDWELAHLGDPMEDLAWLCLRTWRFGNDDAEAGGLASLDVLRNAYTAAGGAWDDAAFSWWTIARLVWWGAILADQAAGFLSGSTTSLVHAASGRRVVEIEYDLLRAIEAAADWREDRRKTS